MNKNSSSSRAVLWLMLAVGLWGGLLALGALLFGYRQQSGGVGFAVDARRGLVVLLCVAAFLGIWGAALWRRSKRDQHRQDSDSTSR